MTTGRSLHKSGKRRRRLRPAASVVVPGYTAALALVAIAVPNGTPPADPPAGRALPAAALAAKRPPAVPPAPRPSHRAERRLVDVIDREAPRPRRITIPATGVSAPVIPLGRNADRTMQTPAGWQDTGWYEPGEQGPAVVVGHVDSTSGPAVFYRLRVLRRANLIRIRRADGSVVHSAWRASSAGPRPSSRRGACSFVS